MPIYLRGFSLIFYLNYPSTVALQAQVSKVVSVTNNYFSSFLLLRHAISVAVTRAGVFANLWNKIGKILKIFERLDYLRSRWVLYKL
jgi:hypothetical protein